MGLLQKKRLLLPWMHAQLHILEIKKWNRDQNKDQRGVFGGLPERSKSRMQPSRSEEAQGKEKMKRARTKFLSISVVSPSFLSALSFRATHTEGRPQPATFLSWYCLGRVVDRPPTFRLRVNIGASRRLEAAG
jgi:hypothetical protein